MKQLTKPVLLVGTGEDCPDLVYATGFSPPDPVLFLGLQKRSYLVVSALELGRARRAVSEHDGRPECTVLTPRELHLRKGEQRRIGRWAARLLKREGVCSVRAPGTFPHAVAVDLLRAGIKVTTETGGVFPERAVKSARELEKIRETQQAAVIAVRNAVATIAAAHIDADGGLKTGGKALTSEKLQQLIGKCLLDRGCFCADTIVAGGSQATDPHEKGHGPLRAGEAIVIDVFPRHLDHRYCGDITRTVVRGQATRPLRGLYRAVRAAQTAALSRIRPGVKTATVHRAAQEEIERRGYKTSMVDGKPEGFFHGTGHGIGLCVHEAPTLGTADGRLRSGHVVTVEPGLYYPKIGGVRIEDTVVVTPTGWQYLVPCEKRFEV